MSTKYKECSCNSLTGGNMNCILAACCKWLNTPGEKLLQCVKATRQASKLIALCIEAFLWKSLFPQYVAQNQVRIKFVQLVAATKFCCRDKDFPKNSSRRTKRFVSKMFPQLVTETRHPTIHTFPLSIS